MSETKHGTADGESFDDQLDELVDEAIDDGVSKATIGQALFDTANEIEGGRWPVGDA